MRDDDRPSKASSPRLLAEYLRELLPVRRERGPAVRDRAARSERLVAIVATLALMAVTSLVPLFGAIVARRDGLEWTGRTSFAPGDLAIYLSSISQAAHGSFFLKNPAGAERAVAVPHPIWFAGGMFARLIGLTPLGAYHALRLALIPLMTTVFLAALRHFVTSRPARIAAFLLLLFGSGVGAYTAYFLPPATLHSGRYEWPTDLWVAESNAFAAAVYSPHFIASWTLLVLAAFLLSRAYERRSVRDTSLAGLAGLALVSFHPFYALTLDAVAAAWLLLWFRRRGAAVGDFAIFAVFCAIPVPAIAYYIWLTEYTPDGAFMRGTNLLWTPAWPFVSAGFAGFLLLAPIGFVSAREAGSERARRAEELALWALVTTALVYAPVAFQRRLLEGVQFPLAALAGLGVEASFARLHAIFHGRRLFVEVLAVLVLLAVFTPTTFYVIARDLAGAAARYEPMFFGRDKVAALAWLRVSVPSNAVVIASVETSNDILGWGDRSVYAGHWSETLDLPRKAGEIERFYASMSSAQRLAFLAEHGIAYAVEGPRERAFGGTLAGDPGFSPVFAQGTYAIYAPRPSKRAATGSEAAARPLGSR